MRPPADAAKVQTGPAPADDPFPAQVGRTRNFTLGVPRNVTVASDGSRVAFLRSRGGDDPITCLWVLDAGSWKERLVFDPRSLGGGDEPVSQAERARRERMRESAGGVVAYAADRHLDRAVFALGSRLFVADMEDATIREIPSPGPVDDPRLDPAGSRIAYVVDGALHVTEIGGAHRVVAADDDPNIRWGLPEFIAAEEMGRHRGFWWSPDASRIAAARVDERQLPVWYLSNPTDPTAPPRPVRHPATGTRNAVVTLTVFPADGGDGLEAPWDTEAHPYLARVDWTEGAPVTLLVQSRDQRTTRVLEVDDATGVTTVVREDTDPAWVELVPGSPARLDDGRLVTTVDDQDTRKLTIGGEMVTPPGLQVRAVLHARADVVFTASDEPTEIHVWRVTPDGGLSRLTVEPGVHTAAVGGGTVVVMSRTAESVSPRTTILSDGEEVATIDGLAETPVVRPRPSFTSLGTRELRTALLLPQGRSPEDDRPLPVLLDPYGGPAAQRVTRSGAQFTMSQWFADQGFAVLVADGRGTPGRGVAWERMVHRNFTVTLDDQVDALEAAVARHPFLDRSRVAIRGWSLGGYLAAMAVLRRPDVFHAGIAGAPVTDQRLYDTHYTERYLGHPDEEPDVYRRNSLMDDAPNLRRPLLLIHGLADDNVAVAHTLRLSAALFAAGRRHELVVLPDLTHLSRSETVTGNLLRVQLDFLRRSLGLPGTDPA